MSNNDYENESNENVSGDLEKNNEPLADEASTIDNNRSEQNRTTDEQQQTYVASSETKPPKQKKSKGWFSGFFSGAIGGVISSVLVVLLLGNQLLPASEGIMDSSGGETASSNASSESIIPTIASDDADVSADISEVSQAVVGVINMQQQNLWEDSQEAGTGSESSIKKRMEKRMLSQIIML